MILIFIAMGFMIAAGVVAIPLLLIRRRSRFYIYLWASYILVSLTLIANFLVRLYRLEAVRFDEGPHHRDPQLDFYFSYPLVLPVTIGCLLYLSSGWGLPLFRKITQTQSG